MIKTVFCEEQLEKLEKVSWGWGCSLMVEHLCSMHEGSGSSTVGREGTMYFTERKFRRCTSAATQFLKNCEEKMAGS
jgi:hypothetical protein